jgi:hypothetical protein
MAKDLRSYSIYSSAFVYDSFVTFFYLTQAEKAPLNKALAETIHP